MTTWDYRVFREANGDLTIREVFYSPDGELLGFSRDAVTVSAGSIDTLVQMMDDLKAALRLPILSLDDIPADLSPPMVGQQTTITHAELLAELGIDHPRKRGRPARQKAS
jgi:hypothetical protein